MQHPGESRRRTAVAAVRGGEFVGAMLVELPLLEDLATATVEVDVPPQHRRQGIGRALWAWAVEHLDQQGRTVVQTEVHVPDGESVRTWPGARFAEALGFGSENVEEHLVLPLPAHPAPVPPAPGYRLVSWAGACPAEFVDAYAAMWSAMSGDVPTGGLTREAARWDAARVRATEARLARTYRSLATLALAADGEPAGYTLVYADLEQPEEALQDDTFVLPQHRGAGLGYRLKLANLAQLDGGPRRLHTWTATGNAPMQRVNARFGFRLVERTHEYQLILR
nr:GNAT family N-acetyltransferase [Modestobacter versicolor]